MSSKLNIRTGDTVMVITGDEMKDRGKTGKVLKVYPEAQRVVVQGRKMIVRHQKPRQQGRNRAEGLKKKARFTFQTLCLFALTAKKPTRVGHTFIEKDGKKSKFAPAKVQQEHRLSRRKLQWLRKKQHRLPQRRKQSREAAPFTEPARLRLKYKEIIPQLVEKFRL